MVLAVTKDVGRKCWACAAVSKKQGRSRPALKVKEWCQKFNHALDRHLRTELTTSDITEAKLFTFVASPFLSDYGADVREESNTQVSHYLHMENFPLKLKKVLTQSCTISTSIPSPSSFLKDAVNIYDFFPVDSCSAKVTHQ